MMISDATSIEKSTDGTLEKIYSWWRNDRRSLDIMNVKRGSMQRERHRSGWKGGNRRLRRKLSAYQLKSLESV